MSGFFIRVALQVLLPAFVAVSAGVFLLSLSLPLLLAAPAALFLAWKLVVQAGRNINAYFDGDDPKLTALTPSGFVARFSTPFVLAIPAAFVAEFVDWHYGFFIPTVTGVSVGGGIFFLAYTAIRIDNPLRFLFHRGRKVLSFREAARKARKKGYRSGFRFGGIQIPERLATNHFLFVGASGSGKTVSIRMLLNDIAEFMRKQEAHAVIYDPKSNVLPLLKRLGGPTLPVIDLHPFRDGSFAWDIAADVRNERDAESVANILIPREEGTNENPFFINAPRELFQAVLRGLMAVAPGNWTLRDAYLILTSAHFLKETLKAAPDAQAIITDYFKGDERTQSNIRLSVRTRLLRYRAIAAALHAASAEGRALSIRQWSESGRGYLVLGAEKTQDSGIEALNRAILQLMTRFWLSGADSPRTPRHFLMLDEVQSAGRINALSQLLNEGREKGVSAVLGFQDVASLRNIYGQDLTEALLGQVGHKALLRLEGVATSEWASRVVGDVERYEYTYSEGTTRGWNNGQSSHSTTTTRNEQFARRTALMPADFLTIPPTNKQNGLTGYYSSPEIGAWKHTWPGRELWHDGAAGETAGREIAVKEGDFPLKPFDADDLKRLSLPPEEPPELPPEDAPEPPEDPPPKLGPVRTDWFEDQN